MRLNQPITNHLKTQNPYQALPIATNDIHRIFPIPQAEVDVNPNIAQNAGYN
jgi:hypothetical protein